MGNGRTGIIHTDIADLGRQFFWELCQRAPHKAHIPTENGRLDRGIAEAIELGSIPQTITRNLHSYDGPTGLRIAELEDMIQVATAAGIIEADWSRPSGYRFLITPASAWYTDQEGPYDRKGMETLAQRTLEYLNTAKKR